MVMVFNNNTIVSLTHIFVVLIVLGLGGFFLFLPWAPNIGYLLAKTILYNPKIIFWFGVVFCSVGLLLLCHFSFLHRFSYLRLHTGSFFCDIKPELIEKAILCYWKERYSEVFIDFQVTVTKNKKLDVGVDISSIEPKKVDRYLDQIQNAVQTVLSKNFHYERDVILTFFSEKIR